MRLLPGLTALAGFALLAGAATAQTQTAPRQAPALSQAIERMARIADEAQFSGEIAIGDASGDREGQAFGMADQTAGRMHRPGERWLWASVTKQVTALLIMQEVEAGRLSLDDTLHDRLPDFQGPTGARITVRQLLQHTSGLPDPGAGPMNDEDVPIFYLESGAGITDAARAQGFCSGPVRAQPGEGFQYNNCDYLVLGAILERSTGRSYADLVRKMISGPLGLTSLRLAADQTPYGGADSVGYLAVGRPHPVVNVATLGAAGALTGTASDLLELDRALLDGRLLSQTNRALLWQGDPALGYEALGVWSFPAPLAGCDGPVALIERRGDFGGIQVRNVIAPAIGRSVVIFTNDGALDFGEIWQGKGLSFDLLSAAFCPA